MAIKFSAKEQPGATVAAKPAKAAGDVKKPSATPKQADGAGEGATDLFLSSEAPKGKTRKKK